MAARAWSLAIALGVAAAVVVAPAALGQDDDGAVLLILDASGSMNATDDAGVRLIDGAQRALVRLVEVLPEGAPVGLRVYGHRVPNTDKANGCLDTELIVPVGPLERGSMIDAIGSFAAKGFTPIGLSLQEAASDLPGGRNTIILVSDGEDTCAPPNPCDVAAELVAGGIDVRVHTVGFFLADGDPAREQLQCIAAATGASYRDVDAIASLTGELGQIIVQSLPGIGNIHLPIQGAVARPAAPLLNLGTGGGPPGGGFGAYQAMLSPGETMWYAIDLDAESFVSVVGGIGALIPGSGANDTVQVVITDDTGAEVQLWESRWGRPSIVLADVVDPQRASFGASTGIGFDNPWSSMSTEERWPLEMLGYDEESHDAIMRELTRRPEPPRAGPGTYYFGFTWSTAATADARPFDFVVSTSPILDSIHLRYQSVAGSAEAATAPLLRPSGYARGPIPPGPDDGNVQGGYVGDIERGTTIWYAVPVGPDEALSVRAFLNRGEGASAGPGETFGVELYDPEMRRVTRPHEDRQPMLALDDPTALDATFLPRGLAPRPLVGAATPSRLGEGTTTEGTHYIAFTWEGPAAGTPAEVEFIVDLFGGGRPFVEGALDRLAAPLVDVGRCPGEPDAYCVGLDTSIEPGDTRWYRVEAPPGMRVGLEAEFFLPAWAQLSEADELRLSIIFEDGTDVTFDHEKWPAVLDLNLVPGVAHAKAVSVCADCDPSTYAQAGIYYLGVTWDSEAESRNAPLALQFEMEPAPENALPPGGDAAATEEEPAAAAEQEDEGPDRGRELAVTAAALVAAGGAGLLVWRRGRRRRGSDGKRQKV
jgi:hypothetical protein